MKNILTLISILFVSVGTFAQEKSKFQAAMEGTLQKMEEAKTREDFRAISNTFGRIADNEPDEWAPLYYQTFIKTYQAFEAKDKAAASAELGELMPVLEEMLNNESDKMNNKVKSEIHTLLGMMCSARMMENPMALGAKYGPMNAEHLKKAIELNKYNPRAYLLQAQTLYFTPESFGGDKVRAKQLAEKAMQLYSSGDPDLKGDEGKKQFLPEWGRQQAQQLLDDMQSKEKK